MALHILSLLLLPIVALADGPGPQDLLKGESIQCGMDKLEPEVKPPTKQDGTGWFHPCSEILFDSQYGLVGNNWLRLQVAFDFGQDKFIGGIKSDVTKPFTQPCVASTSEDNRNWVQRDTNAVLNAIAFTPAVKARYAKFDCPDSHCSFCTRNGDGFHAQFYQTHSRGPVPSPDGGGSGSSGGCDGGCAFLILLLGGGALYVVAGTAYNYKMREQRGIEALPHVAFWKDLPSLVKDGTSYAVVQVRRRAGYSSV